MIHTSWLDSCASLMTAFSAYVYWAAVYMYSTVCCFLWPPFLWLRFPFFSEFLVFTVAALWSVPNLEPLDPPASCHCCSARAQPTHCHTSDFNRCDQYMHVRFGWKRHDVTSLHKTRRNCLPINNICVPDMVVKWKSDTASWLQYYLYMSQLSLLSGTTIFIADCY